MTVRVGIDGPGRTLRTAPLLQAYFDTGVREVIVATPVEGEGR